MKNQKRFTISVNIIMVAVFLIITLFAFFGMDRFRTGNIGNNPEDIKKAIINASVQCYALEGSYPPDLEYLQDHYGVILNEEEYFYYYEIFASNVAPHVEVYEK